jgi:hypothetical protein
VLYHNTLHSASLVATWRRCEQEGKKEAREEEERKRRKKGKGKKKERI